MAFRKALKVRSKIFNANAVVGSTIELLPKTKLQEILEYYSLQALRFLHLGDIADHLGSLLLSLKIYANRQHCHIQIGDYACWETNIYELQETWLQCPVIKTL